MNSTKTEMKSNSLRKSRGFLGSIPKQVALWRVRMTVTMQSCKETQILDKIARFLLIFLRVAPILYMLDLCFKTRNISVRFMEIEAFENVQLTRAIHSRWEQKSVVKSGELVEDFPAQEDTSSGTLNR